MSRRSALAGVALLGLTYPAAAADSPGAAAVPFRDPIPAADGRLVVAQAASQVRELQRALNDLGYNAGPVDGAMGPTTRNAIRTYQADQGLPITGAFSYDLLRRVRETLAGAGEAGAAEAEPSYSTQLVANIQAELRRRGYDVPVVTGQVDAATEQAIRAYQRDRGLAVTGEPSERLLAGLREAGGQAAGGAGRELVRNIQEQLRARGYEVGLLHILSPDEVDPPLAGDLKLVDVETGADAEITLDATTLARYRERLRAWQAELAADAAGRGVHYIPVTTDVPWEQLVMRTLRMKGVLK